mmetsp:Transcript_25634/g.59549  ORF Transcript_25634/g.59549 Transcript_25634/m.59549 type:complete len:80 (+) Transcript_25634:2-241(+)
MIVSCRGTHRSQNKGDYLILYAVSMIDNRGEATVYNATHPNSQPLAHPNSAVLGPNYTPSIHGPETHTHEHHYLQERKA